MNKGDLIQEVAKVVSTKKEAQEAVDCVFSSITNALKKGDAVTVVGFGTFKVTKRKARKGRNPQTGEEIKIKASGQIVGLPAPGTDFQRLLHPHRRESPSGIEERHCPLPGVLVVAGAVMEAKLSRGPELDALGDDPVSGPVGRSRHGQSGIACLHLLNPSQ